MNWGRVTLFAGVAFFAASAVVLFRAEQLADEARSLRADEVASTDDLGDIFVLSHAPGDGNVLDTTAPDGFDALNFCFPLDADELAAILRLSSEQSDRIEAVIESTNRSIRQLLDTPDTRGRTPRAEAAGRRELASRLLDAHPRARGSLRVEVRPVEFRKWTIAGRDVTYGDEIANLIRTARDGISGELDEKQRGQFSTVDLTALFPIPD